MMRRLPKTSAMLVIATLAACDPGPEPRTFPLGHMSPENARLLIEPYVPGGGENIRMSDQPPALTVAASAERLEQIEEMLSRFDVAAPDLRLRFQLIEADGFTGVDPAIADVEAALRDLFRFSGYRLVSESMITAAQHSNSSQRLLGSGDLPLFLSLRVNRISSAGDRSSADIEVTLGAADRMILETRVVVPGGQIVVLGTARPFEDRGALILVVRPEIR
jgi:hypothetical protein